MKKRLAIMLSLLMIIEMLPVASLAADGMPEEEPAAQSETVETNEETVEEYRDDAQVPADENPDSNPEETGDGENGDEAGENLTDAENPAAEENGNTGDETSETAGGPDLGTVEEEESETLDAEPPTSGSCGSDLRWSLAEGVLTISGRGTMTDYNWNANPWFASKNEITSLVIGSGLTYIGNNAFQGLAELTSVTVPGGVLSIGSGAFRGCEKLQSLSIPDGVKFIGSYAFAECNLLETLELPEGVESMGMGVCWNCHGLKKLTIPDSVEEIGSYAFYYCQSLTYIRIPAKIKTIGNYCFGYCSALQRADISTGVTEISWNAFDHCASLRYIYFLGNAPLIQSTAFAGVTAAAYYPRNNASWTSDKLQNYGGTISWANPRTDVLSYGETIMVNGVVYTADAAGCIEPAGEVPRIAAKYTYGGGNGFDAHSAYPVGMAVYLLLPEVDGKYQVYHAEALDNCLRYFGCSIRVSDPQGIRMISGIPAQTKNDLIYGGLYGYTLYEYGTLVQYCSVLGGAELTFDNCGPLYSSAYEIRNEKDLIFAEEDGMVKFTAVLTGFSLDSCKYELAMRPYVKLQHEDGTIVTLYGGTVYRSIGSIASQVMARDNYASGTPEYTFLRNIIDSVFYTTA